MIIADSAVQFTSQHTSTKQYQRTEKFELWTGQRPSGTESQKDMEKGAAPDRDVAAVNRGKVAFSGPGQVKRRLVRPEKTHITEDQKMIANFNMRLLKALFEKITGKKFNLADPLSITATPDEFSQVTGDSAAEPANDGQLGFGFIYEYNESYYEAEKTDVGAEGIINTADGKQIEFTVDLSMSREFYAENNLEVRLGNVLIDPLVLNFDGTAAQLSTDKFHFDIDNDGTEDQISFVEPGSGFLALDKNSDGIINNGSELFGTVSGNGFLDLGEYDADGNMWIDEKDSIYDNLRIWSRDSEGGDSLVSLGTAGVGALYLGHIESQFALKDRDNELLGQIGSTGLAVMDSGDIVTMQQVDLVA